MKKKAARHSLSASDKIDRVVTNRVLALPIFAVVMFLVYWLAMGPLGTFLTDWTNDVFAAEWLQAGSRALMEGWGVAEWLIGLVSDGIIGGVGAVLGFVPQMLVLFLLLAVLEDVGYMARVAFIMDRIFRKFGLSGKSFIPMLIGSGCGVPGVMASRTIENDRDRKMTIMTTCFVPCGAKMPIIGLFAGALFGGSGLVATSAYFIGVAAIILSGVMLKKMRPFAGEPAPFVMELPAYHVPSGKNVFRATWERGWSFIKRAGTVILASSVVLWFLQGFGFVDGVFGMVEDNNACLLASVGGVVAFLFAPLGFGDWQATVATFTGLIAKENVVSTFGVLFHGGDEVAEDGAEIWGLLALRLHRADRLQLHDLQPAVRSLLCGHGRHQARDEQRASGRRPPSAICAASPTRRPDRLSAGRPHHRPGRLRRRHRGGAGGAGGAALPALPPQQIQLGLQARLGPLAQAGRQGQGVRPQKALPSPSRPHRGWNARESARVRSAYQGIFRKERTERL